MRKMIMGCLGVVAALIVAQFALAEVKAGCYEQCSPGPCDNVFVAPCDKAGVGPCDAACGGGSLWNFGGWAEAGFYLNEYGQKNDYLPFNGGFIPESGNTALLHNTKYNGFGMNSIWLFAEKKLARTGLDIGGRADFVYGTDAQFTQSAGLEYASGHGRPWGSGDYYASIAQAYAEVGNQTLSVKAGKFLSPLGYESIMAPNRFFYSLNLGFGALPVTNAGVIGTWNPNKKVSVFGGWVNGQRYNGAAFGVGAGFNDLFFDDSDNGAFLGGVSYKVNRRLALRYAVMIGREDFDVADRDYFVQLAEVVYKWNRWENIFAWTLRNDNFDGTHGGAYGLCDELIYRFNCRWAAGFRAEWMKGFYDGADANAYEFTVGLNWTPNTWLLLRPELRYDKVDGAAPFSTTKGLGLTDKDHQFSAGMSAVVKF